MWEYDGIRWTRKTKPNLFNGHTHWIVEVDGDGKFVLMRSGDNVSEVFIGEIFNGLPLESLNDAELEIEFAEGNTCWV